MKTLSTLVVGFYFVAGISNAVEPAMNPVIEFPGNLEVKKGDKILKLEVDFDYRGKKVMFLSLSHNVNGRAGNIWTAYIPTQTGYLKVEETDKRNGIMFRKDSYYIGPIKGFTNNVLAYYWAGVGGKGTIVGYQLVGNAIHEVIIKEDAEPGGADSEMFKKLFSTKPVSVVEELDILKR